VSVATVLLSGALLMQSLTSIPTFGNTPPEWVGQPVIPPDRFPPEIYGNSGVWVASHAELPILSIQAYGQGCSIRYIDGSTSLTGPFTLYGPGGYQRIYDDNTTVWSPVNGC
jgi:hypothetical protein